MSIIDRYILRLFIKVLVVSFLSLTGLFIVIDTFNNLEEFISYGETQGGLAAVLWDYYNPRVLTFFDRTSSLLVLVAAMFTITILQRHNELTALMAAGISKRRVVKPLIGAAILVSLLAVVNRELLVPRVRDQLTRNAQNWMGDRAERLRPRYDNQLDMLISGRQTVAREQSITEPIFRLHRRLGTFSRQIVAARAYYQPPREGRPGGYLLDEVRQPEDLAARPTAIVHDEPVIFTPRDTTWLESDQCFIVSGVTFEDLVADSSYHRYWSLAQLVRSLRRESIDYGADVRVAVHARLLQPAIDLTLLFLGLPLILTRETRNIFVSAGMCLILVAVYFLVILACQALGGNGYLLSPALAAWLPLIIFVPFAYTLSRPVWSESV